ncbi:MAG: hypothetical protein R2911_40600 [Caldilineaceae bacterium]
MHSHSLDGDIQTACHINAWIGWEYVVACTLIPRQLCQLPLRIRDSSDQFSRGGRCCCQRGWAAIVVAACT